MDEIMKITGATAKDAVESRQVPVLPGCSCPSPSHAGSLSVKSVKSNVSSRSARVIALLEEQHRVRELQLESELRKARSETEYARAARGMCRQQNEVQSSAPKEGEGSRETVLRFQETPYFTAVPRRHPNPMPVDEDFQLDTTEKLSSMLSSMHLPKVELSCFDGNPVNYLKFARQFEYYVESKVRDPGQRMMQLLHYCRGRAREAIEECILLPPSEAYQRARFILQELYGQPYVVARSMISELLEFARSTSTGSDSLSRLGIKMQNVGIALEQLNYSSDLNAMHTLEEIIKRLPHRLQLKWAEEAASYRYEANFSDLTGFVMRASKVANSRFGKIAEYSAAHKTGPAVVTNNQRREQPRTKVFTTVTETKYCVMCGVLHHLNECPQFVALPVLSRWSMAKRFGACFSCLSTTHLSSKCRRISRCGVGGCQRSHHPLLHQCSQKGEINGPAVCTITHSPQGLVCLGVVPVLVTTRTGLVKTLAFLDCGSNTSLIKRSFIDKFEIEGSPANYSVSTLNGTKQIKGLKVDIIIKSTDNLNTIEVDGALSVDDIPVKPIASVSAEAKRWPHLRDLPFDEIDEGEVTILLGCDVPEAYWIKEQRLGKKKQPFASLTPLGWVLFGPSSNLKSFKHHVNLTSVNDQIAEQLKRMYDSEFDDTSIESTTMSKQDQIALELVTKKLRYVDGHFEVPLPWKVTHLPCNIFAAQKRLGGLKNRLCKDKLLLKRYTDLMQSHIEKGYLEPAPIDPTSGREWYMPHHPVFNPKKPDKLRVVFDCASRSHGVSLNDALLQGPDLTSKLIHVLLRFRSHPVAVAADIEEMFLQVRVPEMDRDALRVLWWPGGEINKDPMVYRMTVHPFGATSSPFCANFALRSCVNRMENASSTLLKDAIMRNFYVDDCLASVQDVASAKDFVHELSNVLSIGGFRLTKWVSNSREVLTQVPSSERAVSVRDLNYGALPLERTLGIEWDSERDHFILRFQLKERPLTRRGLLSTVSGLYDPLGFAAPWLLPGKLMLQELCRRKLGWDDELEQADLINITNWLNGIRKLDDLHIPRHTPVATGSLTELHLFSDASELGYGVVAYLCVSYQDSDRKSQLLFSKARVAPLKPVSVPRLELTAAVLATRVYVLLRDSGFLQFDKVYFWTDSMIVLYYIRNVSSRFCTFVANRLGVIHDLTVPDQWSHIRSEENPADMTSRGLYGLESVSTWLNGPSFLSSPSECWPSVPLVDVADKIELKRKEILVNVTKVDNCWRGFCERFSDWQRLLNSMAWLLRFKTYMMVMYGRRRYSIHLGPLKVIELKEAELTVIKLIQAEAFEHELNILTVGASPHDVLKKSNLYKLRPILIDGILRVNSRLKNTYLGFDTIYPIILPRQHAVTKLLIKYVHVREGHAGISHTLSVIRQKFWIPHGAAAVKEVFRSCSFCRRRNAPMGSQLMAPLPSVRVTPGWHPFSEIGIDYFGPFFIKQGRSLLKRYGCVFSCLKSRAVHIEVAHTMDTQSFLMALTRFIGRRGPPTSIYSDNGSNFVSAERELRNVVESFDQTLIERSLAPKAIQWHFIPPYSSHRGGAWERIIRSIRRTLQSVLIEQHPNDETLLTALVEVERTLNQRPLVPVVSDDLDSLALTPNDLLLLRANHASCPTDTVILRYHSRMTQARYLAALFWRRWTKEYLSTLVTRQKWLSKTRNFVEGDVVLVATESRQRNDWPLGIIIESYPDTDGLVRTVDVRTKGGVHRRDIRKLCLLEGGDVSSQVANTYIGYRDAGSPQVGGGSSGLPNREGPPGAS